MNYKITIVSLLVFMSHGFAFGSSACVDALTGRDLEIQSWLDQELLDAVKTGDLHDVTYLISEGADLNTTNRNKSTLLHIATRYGHYNIVELLIAKSSDLLNATNRYLSTPLHVAVQYGHYDVVGLLIEKGSGVNAKNINGNTPLHLAISYTQATIIEFFLRKKADLSIGLNIENNKKETPIELAEKQNLVIIKKLLNGEFAPRKRPPTELDVEILEAVKDGDLKRVHKLIEQDPDVVHARTERWGTPLHVAIKEGHYDVVELLIEKEANVNAKNVNGNTLLHIAVTNRQTTIIEFFLRKKAEGLNIDLNIENNKKETPIELAEKRNLPIITKLLSGEFAPRKRLPTELDIEVLEVVKTGDLKRVHELIEEDPNVVHARTEHWSTPLHVAIEGKHYDVVKLLIEKGADVNAKNISGNTPLHIAVRIGSTVFVKLLIKNNAKVDIKNDNEKTPIKIAKEKGRGEIREFLEDGGELRTREVSLTWLDKELIKAVEIGNLGEIRELIENQDANIDVRTPQGKSTLLHLAAKNGYYDVVELLIEKAPDLLNAKNQYWGTPLHVAIKEGHYDVVELLIEKEANVNAKNVNGNTPLHIAVSGQQTTIVEFFLRKKADLSIDFDIKNNGDKDNPDGYTPIELAEKRGFIIITKLLSGEFTPRKRPPTELDIEVLEVVKTGDLKRVHELIEEDPNVVHARTEHWSTPLHVAIEGKHYDVVKLLIEKGADINAKNVYGNTPLHIAVSKGQITIVEFFLRKKDGLNIDFDVKNDGDEDNPDGYTPIELAEKRNSIIIKKLLTGEFSPRKRPPTDNDTRILEAVKVGDLKRVHKLIEQDSDVVHARTEHWSTPLHVVIREGHYDIVELLIEQGSDVNAKNVYGNTPLHIAVSKGQITIVEFFLRKKDGLNIDFDVKNDGDEDNPDGYTPIELAEKRNSIIIKKLLTGEFSPRKRPPTDNDTRILEAVKVGDLKRVHKLIEQDSDVVHARTEHWSTPLHVVIREGHYDIVELLIEQGSDVNAKNLYGNTPLHTAVRISFYKAIDILLTIEELIVDEVNDKGETALDLAIQTENEVIFDLLVDKFFPKGPLASLMGLWVKTS